MSRKFKFYNPEGLYFTTTTVVHWIDLFTRKEYKHLIVDALKYSQDNQYIKIYAWCLMPSHLHMILTSAGKKTLSEFFRDFKKFTAKEIIKNMDLMEESRRAWLSDAFLNAGNNIKRIKYYKVWIDGNHPIELISNKFIKQKLEYIHLNPVMAEIVGEPYHYLYSSARNYAGLKGYLDVEIIED